MGGHEGQNTNTPRKGILMRREDERQCMVSPRERKTGVNYQSEVAPSKNVQLLKECKNLCREMHEK